MNLTALKPAYANLGSGDALISCDDAGRIRCLWRQISNTSDHHEQNGPYP